MSKPNPNKRVPRKRAKELLSILLITEPAHGLTGSYIGNFKSEDIEEACEHSEIFMRGMLEDGFDEKEVVCITFANKCLAEIKREIPLIFLEEDEDAE